MRRVIHIIVLAAFVFSCGGHWYVLQAVAWANMIREYSQFVPLSRAVSMTFSGQYPCAICQALAEKKQNDNQAIASFDKYEKFLAPVSSTIAAALSSPMAYPEFLRSWTARTEPPPTPPPRLALS